MYRIYYIKNSYMFRHFTLAIFRLRNEKKLVSSYTRLMWAVYSGEVWGEVGTRSCMCYVGWVVWVHGFCCCMLCLGNIVGSTVSAYVCRDYMYEGESTEDLKSAIKIRTAGLSCKFQQWYSWFEEWPTGGSTILHRKWSHCVPFVFDKLRDKPYLRFSFDSPSFMQT